MGSDVSRVAVVTGGAGGLGTVIAGRLAATGTAVAVVDLDGAAASRVAAQVSQSGVESIGVAADVSQPASVAQMVDTVAERFGRIDVLVNGAGGSLGTPRDLEKITPEDFDLVVGVNLRGTFLCCQAVAPVMAEGGGGSIVNISSVAGRSASPVTGVPYAAAKAGVLGLTRRLAREVGPSGIRVNAVALGLFLSGARLEGMWQSLAADEQREVLDSIALRRLPDLHEAADPIVFLAGPGSSYITGAVLDVNGGRFMSG